MRRSLLCLTASLLFVGCAPTGDDDDDSQAPCEGTMDWTFNTTADAGADGATCALSQGPTFITINTANADNSVNWQVSFSDFAGEGTFDIVSFGDWNITGYAGESWWATAGTITVETWADPELVGTFDATGANADDSATMSISGSFDVTVAPYVE